MILDVKKVKIIVTVPKENTGDIRKAMSKAGAGIIGNYSFCSTSVDSIGTFLPNNKSKPYIGKKNELEFVHEDRLEMICDIKNVKKVVSAIRKHHPYEEPAIDIVPLIDENDIK